jgi:PhzF family phenazine biosynthesis protein
MPKTEFSREMVGLPMTACAFFFSLKEIAGSPAAQDHSASERCPDHSRTLLFRTMRIPAAITDRPMAPGLLPKAAGHYSQGVLHEGILYISGQLPEREGADELKSSSSFDAQMLSLLQNCDDVLRAWGCSPSRVLAMTVYLTDLRNWVRVDEICASFFGTYRPTRTVVGVAEIRKGYAVQFSYGSRLAAGANGTDGEMTQRILFHIDVFTRAPFRGNPAGVVIDADGMSDEQMQLLARELKHSETAFVFRADGEDHDVRVRYFTPTTEVPLCGHATIAAHAARAHALKLSTATIRQKTRAGLQTIGISRGENGCCRVVMHQGQPRFETPLSAAHRQEIVCALGLLPSDLLAGAPVQVVSTGHSKIMVPLGTHVDLDGLKPDMHELVRLSQEIGCNGYFPFQLAEDEEGVTHGRMFAPAIGIEEDPVTGNANGPLGAYLVKHRLMPHDGVRLRFQGRQGRALRRDGVVHVEVKIREGEAESVSIAGDVCIVFAGPLLI